MRRPLIKTDLPGPEAARLIQVDQTYVSPSYTRIYPLVVKNAQGLWVTDADDNSFLDFTAGIAVCATGHCHPRVVQAIKDQADRLLHMSGTDFYYEPQIVLARKLASWRREREPTEFTSGTQELKQWKRLLSWPAIIPEEN